MHKNIKYIVLLIVLVSCTALTYEEQPPKHDYSGISVIRNQLIEYVTKNTTIKGDQAVRTKYIVSFFWTIELKYCQLCKYEAKKMFLALSDSKIVKDKKMTLLMVTDADLNKSIVFLTDIFYETGLDPDKVLPAVNFYLFHSQQESFKSNEFKNVYFPGVVIGEQILGEVITLYYKMGEPVSWELLDQIILGNNNGTELYFD